MPPYQPTRDDAASDRTRIMPLAWSELAGRLADVRRRRRSAVADGVCASGGSFAAIAPAGAANPEALTGINRNISALGKALSGKTSPPPAGGPDRERGTS